MRRLAGILLALVLIPACSWPTARGPAEDQLLSANRMISKISQTNKALRPFKGLGNIRIGYGDTRWSARAAWIANPRARCLRLEIMGPAGTPVARLIVNASSAFFARYDHGAYHSRALGERSLYPIVHIPVTVDEFILFLSGSIPVKTHDRLVVDCYGNANRRVVSLKKRWWGMVEKIGFIPGKQEVTDVEMFGWPGSWFNGWFGRRYRVDRVPARDAESENAFSAMIFSHSGVRVRLEPDRQWRDVRIPANAFDVEPSAQ